MTNTPTVAPTVSDRKKNDKILPAAALILCAIFPVFFLFFQNVQLLRISEIFAPLGVYILFAAVFFAISLLIQRSYAKAVLNALVILIAFQYFALAEKLVNKVIKSMYVWHFILVVVFIIGHLSFFIYKKIKEENAVKIEKIVFFFFSFLVVLNIVMAVPSIVSKQSDIEKPANPLSGGDGSIVMDERPNVYFFLFDEMANVETVKKFCDYDNSALYKNLESKHFTVSPNSRSHATDTFWALAGYYNLKEIRKSEHDYSVDQLRQLISEGVLFDLAKKAGYEVVGLGSTGNLNIGTTTSVASTTKTMEGYNFADIVYNYSILYLRNFSGQLPEEAKSVLSVKNYFESDASFSGEEGKFYLTYLASPHQPFVFDENGNVNQSTSWSNWNNSQYYLGQYLYISNLIENITDRIVQKDPNSIIIIMSDHGPRGLSSMTTEDKSHIMNAVYFKGDALPEIVGQSGVNSLKVVFSKLFNLDLQNME